MVVNCRQVSLKKLKNWKSRLLKQSLYLKNKSVSILEIVSEKEYDFHVVINESNVHILSDSHATNSGVYTFTFGDGSAVTARFSYLYVATEAGWKILQHHSSAMPEG